MKLRNLSSDLEFVFFSNEILKFQILYLYLFKNASKQWRFPYYSACYLSNGQYCAVNIVGKIVLECHFNFKFNIKNPIF